MHLALRTSFPKPQFVPGTTFRARTINRALVFDDGDSRLRRLESFLEVRVLALCAWLWLLVALPFVTDVTTSFPVDLVLSAGWLMLISVWLGIPFISSADFQSPRWRRWWLAAGCAGLICGTLAFTDIGLIVRLYLCETQLNAYADTIEPGAVEHFDDPITVGSFHVDETDEYNGVVAVYTCHGFLNRYGIARIPEGASTPPWLRGFRHLYGQWYSFEWR
jgi:hypothetical protein